MRDGSFGGLWIRSSPTDEAGRWTTDPGRRAGSTSRTPREVSRRDEVQLEQPSVSRGGPGVRIYPYGVNRNKIEQFVRGLRGDG